MLHIIVGNGTFLVWWQLEDMNQGLLRAYGVVVKLSLNSIVCLQQLDSMFCNLSAREDFRHFLLQCPWWQDERYSFLIEIGSKVTEVVTYDQHQ